MNKKLILVSIFLMLCVICFGCSNQQEKLENVPSKVILYDSEEVCIGEIIYDEYGNSTKYTLFDAEGNITSVSETSYEYDRYGNITKTTCQNGDESDVKEYKYEYSNGQIVGCEGTLNGESLGDYVYENGHLSKQTKYDNEGEIVGVIEYVYDEDGNLAKETQSIFNPEAQTILEYAYDEYGNVIISSQKMIKGENEQVMLYEYQNEYDSDGKLLRIKRYYITEEDKEFVGRSEFEYEN